MKCDVIHITLEGKSFDWANGLYFILKIEDKMLHLVKINKDGTASTYDDGRYYVSCTGVGNRGIVYTQLIYETDKLIHDRTLKLTKLLKNGSKNT